MLLVVWLLYFGVYFSSFYLCLVPPYLFCFHVFMFLCCFFYFSTFFGRFIRIQFNRSLLSPFAFSCCFFPFVIFTLFFIVPFYVFIIYPVLFLVILSLFISLYFSSDLCLCDVLVIFIFYRLYFLPRLFLFSFLSFIRVQ